MGADIETEVTVGIGVDEEMDPAQQTSLILELVGTKVCVWRGEGDSDSSAARGRPIRHMSITELWVQEVSFATKSWS